MGRLGVDPALDRVPAELDVLLGDRELLPGRDPDLLADDVDPGDHLGHAVLDLDAGVHLEEEVLVAVLKPLDRARRAIADGRCRVRGDLADALAHLLVHVRSRGLLDQLLVAPLDRAVALAQVDHVAVRVGEHLHLDVARILEVALEVDARVREELLALARGPLERLLELVLGARARESPCRRRRRPPCRRPGSRSPWPASRASSTSSAGDVVPGTIGTPASDISSRARVFDPIASIALAGGPMNTTPGLLAGLGEVGVLGEESVSGVDRLGPGLLGRLEDLLDVQVALGRNGRAQQMGLVGLADVRSLTIRLRVHAHGDDPHLLQRPHDANGDLAPVGDQDLLEHGA